METIDTIIQMPELTTAQRALRREADKAWGVLGKRMAGKTYRVLVTVAATIAFDADGNCTGTVVAEDTLHTELAAMDEAAKYELSEMDNES